MVHHFICCLFFSEERNVTLDIDKWSIKTCTCDQDFSFWDGEGGGIVYSFYVTFFMSMFRLLLR